jgi:hypothetical protein
MQGSGKQEGQKEIAETEVLSAMRITNIFFVRGLPDQFACF